MWLSRGQFDQQHFIIERLIFRFCTFLSVAIAINACKTFAAIVITIVTVSITATATAGAHGRASRRDAL